MEAVACLDSKKRVLDTSIDWNLCCLCQKTAAKKTLRTLGENGCARIQQVVCDRKKYNDHVNNDILERLSSVNLAEIAKTIDILNHKECYATFTNSGHIDRLKTRFQAAGHTSVPQVKVLHSGTQSLITGHCIFCQRETSMKTKLFATMDVSDKVLKMAKYDYVMRCRLAGVNDLIAADAQYHLQCYVQFTRKFSGLDIDSVDEANVSEICMEKVAQEVSIGVSEGNIYSLKDVWDRYCQLLEEFKEHTGKYKDNKTRFKEKLNQLLQGKIEFVPQLDPHQPQLLFPVVSSQVLVQTLKKRTDELNESRAIQAIKQSQFSNAEMDELLTLHHTALQIRQEIKDTPGLTSCATVKKEDITKVVPECLYMFISLLLTGNQDEATEDNHIENIALSISQDIVYAVSKRKKLTPKHIGIGMTIHQATRSKNLVEIVHHAGHCISYDQVRRLEASLAKRNLEQYVENGNVPIPSNLAAGKFFQFAADNIDIIEESLDGMGTFHATQMVTFQRGKATCLDEHELVLGKEKSLTMPTDFHQLEQAPYSASRVPPSFIEDINKEMYTPNSDVADKANAKDISWVLTRIYGSDSTAIPAWTGFNQVTTEDNPEVCSIGYLPLINAPAHENDTLWTVLLRCMKISDIVNPGQSTVVTLDQQLYCKAKELQWANPDVCKTMFVRLGGFHIAKNFMQTIGQHFADSGLQEVWMESKVFGENTAYNNMQAKSYNRAIRAHKLTFEALWKLVWPMVTKWATDQEMMDEEVIKSAAICVVQSLDEHDNLKHTAEALKKLQEIVQETDILKILDAFAETQPPTNQYWISYIQMVFVLLQFIRAERTGNWELHISAFSAMLPWFAIYDHTNYTRWGSVYLADVRHLQKTHPEVYAEFLQGNFVVKSTQSKFNQLSTDQALEHVNKMGKIAGGLIGITRSDGARDQWCLTFNERSRLVDETRALLDIHAEDKEYSPTMKDVTPSRIKRDKDDVKKISDQFERFGVFRHDNQDVVCLATCDIAPANITTSLLSAQTRGAVKVNQFVESRLCTNSVGFHDKLQQSKSPTLRNLYQVESKSTTAQKGKTVKADRALFQRLLVSKDAGRDIDLKTILCHELSPVPLSLADITGQLRSTNKAILGQILQSEATVLEVLPSTTLKTCTIIDGQALVQAIGKPAKANTFGDLADIFTGAVFSHFSSNCTRVDVAFDRYEKNMIKDATRARRAGSSRPIRRQIESRDVPLPVRWKQFIDLPENKADLENFLSGQLITSAKASYPDCELVTSGGFNERTAAESSRGSDVTLLKSDQDEADTRIILHAKMVSREYGRIIVSCRDTDVLVLLVHFESQLSQEIWFRTGTAKQRRFVAVHDINLDTSIRRNLPAYHSVTGCDTVSQFCGLGKKSTWKVFLQHSNLLDDLGVGALTGATVEKVEEFICRMYAPNMQETSINDIRYKLFQKGNKAPEQLPPTQLSLHEHIKRAHHQSRIWYTSTIPQPNIGLPVDQGWYMNTDGELRPKLMMDISVPMDCLALTQCNCKMCETGRCSCRTKKLRCTGACGCSDRSCQNPHNVEEDSDEDI